MHDTAVQRLRENGMTRLFLKTFFAAMTAAIMAGCATTADKAPQEQPARNPLPNTDTSPATTFRAESTTPQSCSPPAGAPFGDIAYSGIVKTGEHQWVYLRDTKTCLSEEWKLTNQYFGFVNRQDGLLVGSEVPLMADGVETSALPHDLEAFCLLKEPVITRNPDETPAADFGHNARLEMLAVESGGYEPEGSRRIFKLEFKYDGTRWSANIVGQSVSYHQFIISHAGIPADFEAEGMLCDSLGGNRYSVTLASRGRHEVAMQNEVGGTSGGLLRMHVDFDKATIAHAEPEYIGINAPKCSLPAGAKAVSGEWRDISDLYRTDDAVWATSVFEGEIENLENSLPGPSPYFCSTIYMLCTRPDCSDLAHASPSVTTTGFDFPGRKIEGLSQGDDVNTFAIASDEETTGAINVNVPAVCAEDCEKTLHTENHVGSSIKIPQEHHSSDS